MNKVYKHAQFSSTILASVSSNKPKGLGWASNCLVVVDEGADKILVYSGFFESLVTSFSTQSIGANALDTDGENILEGDMAIDRIFKHVGLTSSIEASIGLPLDAGSISGLAWDNSDNLISCAPDTDKIYRHSGFSTKVLESFDQLGGGNPSALAWKSSDLISGDNLNERIRLHQGFSTTVLDSFSSPNVDLTGLAWPPTAFYEYTLREDLSIIEKLLSKLIFSRELAFLTSIIEDFSKINEYKRESSKTISASEECLKILRKFLHEEILSRESSRPATEYARKISESLWILETFLRVVSSQRKFCETSLILLELISTLMKKFQETISAKVTFFQAIDFIRTLEETPVSIVDSYIKQIYKDVSESLSVIETFSRVLTTSRDISELAKVIERFLREATYPRKDEISSIISDYLLFTYLKLITLKETTSAIESFEQANQFLRELSELSSIIDPISREQFIRRTIKEIPIIAERFIKRLFAEREKLESVAILELVSSALGQLFERVFSELVSSIERTERIAKLDRAYLESILSIESITKLTNYQRRLKEISVSKEALVRSLEIFRSIDEETLVSPEILASLGVIIERTLLESVRVEDTFWVYRVIEAIFLQSLISKEINLSSLLVK